MDLNLNKLRTSKKVQPQISDALPVILEQLQDSENKFQNIKETLKTFDASLEKFYKHETKLNIDNLTIANQKNLDELKKNNKELIDAFKDIAITIIKNINDKSEEIKNLKSLENKVNSKLFLILIIIFVFTFVGTMMSLYTSTHIQNEKENQIKLIQRENNFKQYLHDHHDEEKYLKWANKNQ
ncbi:hypothetical protein [Flavobacterium sp. GNP002]